MPKEGAENNATDKTEHEADQKGLKHFRPLWLSDVVACSVCAAVAGVLGYGGTSLLNSHPKPVFLAWGTIWLAIIFAGWASGFWLINHRKKQPKNKMPIWAPRCACWGSVLLGGVFFAYAVWNEEPQRQENNDPIVSPKRVQLHDGTFAKQSEITIVNPGNLPVHLLWLRLQPEPRSVSCSSVRIKMDQIESPPGRGFEFEYGRIDTMPSDRYPNMNESDFIIYSIPPKSHRTLFISGTVAVDSWADLSIIEFHNDFETSLFATNGVIWPMIFSNSAFWKKGTKGFTITNFSFEMLPSQK